MCVHAIQIHFLGSPTSQAHVSELSTRKSTIQSDEGHSDTKLVLPTYYSIVRWMLASNYYNHGKTDFVWKDFKNYLHPHKYLTECEFGCLSKSCSY